MITAAKHASRSLVLGAALTLSACGYGPKFHYTTTMNVAHRPASALEVVNANGSLRAVQEERADVAVEAELYGPDEERLRFAQLHADRKGDGSLRVWIEWPGGKRRGNEGARIEIYTPGTDGVNMSTSNGSVTLLGLGGNAVVESTNGSVLIEDQGGGIDASTTNGSVRVERPGGEVFISTTNGRIIIDGAPGPIEVTTTNGNATVSTRHGNPGPVRVRTTNGNITLELGEGFVGVLNAKTSNGRLSADGFEHARLIESSNHALKIRVGDSDAVSAAHSTNGSIRIRAKKSKD